MKSLLRSLSLIIMLIIFYHADCQTYSISNNIIDESDFYMMTKQMSQFFSRFNNEEDQYGVKYHPDSPEYRDNKRRAEILPILFDSENPRTSGKLRDMFIADVTSDEEHYMEFLGGEWFSEVSATFLWKNKPVSISLILTVEQENLGSKWVLTNVIFTEFNKMFPSGEMAEREKHFLHPMSHELDFFNIHKAFRNPQYIEYYSSKNYYPDYLTLFFYEIKNGNLTFENVDVVKFHIFQIGNWYFEVSWFNRTGHNAGWLISNLIYLKDEEKASLLKFYQPK